MTNYIMVKMEAATNLLHEPDPRFIAYLPRPETLLTTCDNLALSYEQ